MHLRYMSLAMFVFAADLEAGPVDLRPHFNASCFDDGIADNGSGGWTDEGLNDFFTYPPLDFGFRRFRGYAFDLVDPAANEGRNLVLQGHRDVWPDTPAGIDIPGVDQRGRFLFVMHSEGRIRDETAGREAGSITLRYADGSEARLPLRMGRELHNWYQGNWWNNYEEARPDAPEALAKSKCNPEKYRELGGTDFKADVLAHADALRWPVTQGLNYVSKAWSIPVVFWALRWEHPHPEKMIASIRIDSDRSCLIGIAAITISDEDYSLLRHTEEGGVRRPEAPPGDFFVQREREAQKKMLPLLASQEWTKGVRRVEMRADDIVSVVIDHIADIEKLKDPAQYMIRSDDDPAYRRGVHPVGVYRFSRGSRYRKLGNEPPRVYMDHWAHLKLPAPLKPDARYTVAVAGELIPGHLDGLNRRASFVPSQTPNPGFKLNQVGYSSDVDHKYAFLSSYLGDGPPVDLDGYRQFEVVDDETGKTVMTGALENVADRDRQGLDRLYRMDLSALRQPGRFFLRIPGLGRSYTFLNGPDAVRRMYDICHRGLFFQRSGQAVEEPYAEGWTRPLAHTSIFVTVENLTHPIQPVDPSQPGHPYFVSGGPQPFRGGHYDAGDYDIRPMHINVPELLLSLYEAMPEKFFDGQVNIPENRNGIPDIVDEAVWNLQALEQIQDYASGIRGLSGGVAPGLETYTHPGAGQGMGRDPLPYYMRKVTSYFSLSAAAEFAHMARIMDRFDHDRGRAYLRRAVRAYDYAMQHPDEDQPLMSNGRADQGEGWKPEEYARARLWANVELYCTTGEQSYWDELVRLLDTPAVSVAGSVRHGVLFSLLISKRTHPDPAVVDKLRKALLIRADNRMRKLDVEGRDGYGVPAPERGGWGITSCLARNIEEITRAYMLTRRPGYRDVIARAIDFPFGMNPSEMSWVTGGGTVYPMDPLNLNCLVDGIEDPHPGILIYGPTDSWKNNSVLLYPDKAGMGFYRRITDSFGIPAQNEYTVWETQAPLLFAVGCLLPDRE